MLIEESNLRQEIKFFASSLQEANAFLASLRRLPHFLDLKEVYRTRVICNIYFDSIHRDAQTASIEGYPTRSKIRARWYQSEDAEIVVSLEQKIKISNLGKKVIRPLFTCDNSDSKDLILQRVRQHLTSETQHSFMATLYNSYDRKYFATAENLRVTIDSNLIFSGIQNNQFEPHKSFPGYIIEVKIPPHIDASNLLSLSLARKKISKFSIGLAYVE